MFCIAQRPFNQTPYVLYRATREEANAEFDRLVKSLVGPGSVKMISPEGEMLESFTRSAKGEPTNA